MDDFLKQILEQKDNENKRQGINQRQAELLSSNEALQQAVFEAARNIISAQSPEVLVMNFPEQLATGDDIRALADVLDKNTVKTQAKEEIRSDGLSSGLKVIADKLDKLQQKDSQTGIVDAVKAIEFPKSIEVSNLDDLGDFFFSLEQKLGELDIRPEVNVEVPEVEVPAPDLTPITKELQTIREVFESIEIPQPKLDGIEKLLRRQNTLLEKILTRPIPVGSGGAVSTGTAAAAATDISGGLDNLLLADATSHLTLQSDTTNDVLLLA